MQGNAQGMDPYAYVGGNPETRTDPTGQMFPCSSGCGGSGGGGGSGSNPCTSNPDAKGCPGYKPPCSVTGPQPGNHCTYSSGACQNHTYNQCQSWKTDADTARNKALKDLNIQAFFELLAGYLLFAAGDLLTIFDKSASTFDRLGLY